MSDDRWKAEVAKAIVELVQDVHALDPGLSFYFDLGIIAAAIPEDER